VQIVKDKGGQGEQIDGLGKSTGEVKNIFENILFPNNIFYLNSLFSATHCNPHYNQ
jgi:hypothetical protein